MPHNKPVKFETIHGKVVEHWMTADSVAMFRQLGVKLDAPAARVLGSHAMRLLSALGILAIGCSNGSSKGASRCQSAVERAENEIEAREKPNATDPSSYVKAMAVVTDLLVGACKRDGWSDGMLACVENVTARSALYDCLHNQLAADQASALTQQLLEALANKRKAEHVPGLP